MKGTAKIAGRARGTPNAVTVEIRVIARELLSDPEYLASLREPLLHGTLAPALERELMHYAYGRPTVSVEVTDQNPLTIAAIRTLRDRYLRSQGESAH